MESLKEIHYIQESYRKLLDTMAMPGSVEIIKSDSIKYQKGISFFNSTYIIMKILLDRETTFKVVCENQELDENIINGLTGGVLEEFAKSDFVFVEERKNALIGEVIDKVSRGTLINPELGSTIICEVEEILDKETNAVLSGPGILNEIDINLPILEKWLEKRNEKNKEYPMGVDLIFLDKKGKVLSIPRTVKIKRRLDN